MIRTVEGSWMTGVLNFLWMLVRWKRFLFWNTFLATSAAIAGAYLAQEVFRAEMSLMPPNNEKGGLSEFMRDFPLTKLAMGPSAFLGSGSKNSEDLYLAILGSRTLKLDVIEKFNLRHYYVYGDTPKKTKKEVRVRVEDLLKAFSNDLNVIPTEEGTIVIKYENRSPVRAAAVVNYMGKKLDAMCKNLAMQTQSYQRRFLEERLAIVRADLQSAEDSLVAFQKKHKMVNMEEQGKASIEEGALLEAQFLNAELDLEVSRGIFLPNNPRITEKELELRSFQKQREKLSSRRQSDLLIPYAIAPDLGMEFVRLNRRFKVQEAIFEFLIPQYEQAKIEEARNTPNVQVLDHAMPPEEKVFPPKRKMVQIAFGMSIFWGLAVVFLLENLRKLRESNSADFANLRRFLGTVFSWKFFLRP